MVAKVIEDGKSWMVKRETQKEIIPATAATCVHRCTTFGLLVRTVHGVQNSCDVKIINTTCTTPYYTNLSIAF